MKVSKLNSWKCTTCGHKFEYDGCKCNVNFKCPNCKEKDKDKFIINIKSKKDDSKKI